ncbi:hypothetical protein BJ166DRAFT_77837 [Pestalotiopsis sp. NC0098]|nr:hypothetical protein BJ166DRAFT_77837 [Pestalotiopsis sp. NC0098]
MQAPVNLHHGHGHLSPGSAHATGVGNVPQIAQHAGILDGALLASLVALVVAVGAHEREDPLQDGHGELQPGRKYAIVQGQGHEMAVPPVVAGLAILGLLGSVAGVAVVVEVCGLGFRLLAPPEELGEAHGRDAVEG